MSKLARERESVERTKSLDDVTIKMRGRNTFKSESVSDDIKVQRALLKDLASDKRDDDFLGQSSLRNLVLTFCDFG